MEKMLIQRCLAGIPRDLDLLEQLVIEHKQFENDLSSRELEVSGKLTWYLVRFCPHVIAIALISKCVKWMRE